MNNWLWIWGPMIAAAAISLLVMWFIVMDFIRIAPPDTPSFSYGEEGGTSLLS